MAKLKKIVGQTRHAGVGSLKKPDGTYTQDTKESIQLLVNNNFPDSREGWDEPETERPFVRKDFEWLTMERLKRAINKLDPHKACGPDEIKPVVLQNLPDNALRSSWRSTPAA